MIRRKKNMVYLGEVPSKLKSTGLTQKLGNRYLERLLMKKRMHLSNSL
jgi:hypothetical protein